MGRKGLRRSTNNYLHMNKKLFTLLMMLMTVSLVWAKNTAPAVEQQDDEHMYGYWVVFIDRNGGERWIELWKASNGDYVTVVSLTYSVYGGYRPGVDPVRQVPFYYQIDGVRYGAPSDSEEVVLSDGWAYNPLIEVGGYYTLPVGYLYTIGVLANYSDDLEFIEYSVLASIGGSTGGNPADYVDDDTNMLGDADGDGRVSIADVTVVIDYLLTLDASIINLDNADCDKDGKISIADVTSLIEYLLVNHW